MKKGKKITFLVILFFLVLAFFLYCFFDSRLTLYQSNQEIPANGNSVAHIKVFYKNPVKRFFKKPPPATFHITKGESLVTLFKNPSHFYLKSLFTPGVVHYTLSTLGEDFKGQLTLFAGIQDGDFDGFPDAVELTSQEDRHHFLQWFVWIAESQFYKISLQWQEIHHDCAGLITFAVKEALKVHDNQWFEKSGYFVGHVAPDVQKYSYPHVPLLETKIFRIKAGPFNNQTKEEDFSNSATANILMNYNMVFISKNKEEAQKGDVIFFRRENNPKSPYHSMIYLGESNYLVYHTGGEGEKTGVVRKVLWQDLLKHPDKDWHPAKDNPAFLGIYRFKIVL